MKSMGERMHNFKKSIEELGRVIKMEYVIYGAQTIYFFNNGDMKRK